MSQQDRSIDTPGNGRKEQFMVLFRPLHARLDRFARAMTGDIEEARDLVHDTVVVAFEGFERVKDRQAFLSYLFTIASRLHGKRKRRMKWWGDYNEKQAEDIRDRRTAPDTSADVALLHDALQQLPESQREAVALFEISGLSLEEIREVQGGSLSGVKSRVTRGRRRLSELLGADEDPAVFETTENTRRNGTTTDDTTHIILSSGRTR
jgi:RNA polymerase sigma-70 factor (ECF subfamily)